MAAPNDDFTLTLDYGNTSILLTAQHHGHSAFDAFMTGAVTGLYGTPTSKTSLTERQTANGAHSVTDAEVLYSARTVTIPVAITQTAAGGSLDSMRDEFGLLTGHIVRLTVHDRGMDTFLHGFLTITWSGAKHNDFDTGTITLTCADPVRYSVGSDSATLLPTSTIGYSGGSGLGLYYGPKGIGLYYPIRYGAPDQTKPSKGGTGTTPPVATQQNVAVLYNHGDCTSWPVITMQGRWQGARFDWSASDRTYGTLAWKGQVTSVSAVFDCKSHTVSVNGVDDSSKLTFRSFPHVPPSGSCRIVLVSGGRGTVNVSCHDTWI